MQDARERWGGRESEGRIERESAETRMRKERI